MFFSLKMRTLRCFARAVHSHLFLLQKQKIFTGLHPQATSTMKIFMFLSLAALAMPVVQCGSSSDSGQGRDYPAGQCEICSRENKDRPDSLTLRYVGGQGAISQYQSSGKASCRNEMYPNGPVTVEANGQTFDVSPGVEFTVDGSFGAETEFEFSTGEVDDCYIHTSCSVPLVAGDQIGPFLVIGGNDCPGGPPNLQDPDPTGECEICSKENKNRPDSLTLQYFGGQGAISRYQDSGKASCRDDIFPDEPVTIEANGQTFDVSPGDIFTVDGRFSAETDFEFSTGEVDDCYIHTSCSAPLVAGDQIGPFLVLEGNECVYTPPCECKAEGQFVNGRVEISFDYCGAEPNAFDWVGVYPCDAEVMTADADWDEDVFYENVFEIGYNEGEVYVNQNPHWLAYTCGSPDDGCQRNPLMQWPTSGTMVLDPANAFFAPWAFTGGDSIPPGCYKAHLNRETIISGPPYPTVCKTWAEANEFVVT